MKDVRPAGTEPTSVCLPMILFRWPLHCALLFFGLVGLWRAPDRGGVVSNAAADETTPAARDPHGFWIHHVQSELQAGPTQIRVLLPSQLREGKRYRVVYILPVEAGTETRYGDGLLEVQQQKLHDRYDTIFVSPTFTHLPWYTDHSTRADLRQEAYFLQVVLPLVRSSYPVSGDAADHRLLGFSKSGWGAWSLVLRNPKQFGGAAAWDAPLMMAEIGKYGTSPIFGSQENFQSYRLTDLLRLRQSQKTEPPRLVLTSFGNFRTHHQEMHALLQQLRIPHRYRDGPSRAHTWHSGWVPEAVRLLLEEQVD